MPRGLALVPRVPWDTGKTERASAALLPVSRLTGWTPQCKAAPNLGLVPGGLFELGFEGARGESREAGCPWPGVFWPARDC